LKLKGLYKFGIIYEENKGHILRLLKLCSEAEGLSQLEKLRQWHLNEIHGMETERHEIEKEIHRLKAEKEKYENALFLLKSEILTLKYQIEDYRESCERERLELEKLKKEKESIEKSLRLGDIAE
jgi:chromosome segregation ATPase